MTSDATGRIAWLGVAVLLAAGALAGWPLARDAIDWQPQRASSQPWRAWSAIGVHYSGMHLGVNLLGLAITALFGLAARVPARLAGAWLVAWPLTQLGLGFRPELAHYGGLSGVLHAGVAAVIVFLLATGTRAQRWVTGALGLGLVAKLMGEAPWGPVLRHPPEWDIAVAPLAHTTGAIAGAACAAFVLGWSRRSAPRCADA